MAKLSSIRLKVSRDAAADLKASLEGSSSSNSNTFQIEEGEVVVRLGNEGPELWTIDGTTAKQVVVDVSGSIPAWDPADLAGGVLSQLSDVNVEEGIGSSGPGLTEAGYVLTWDGLKWVVRPAAGYEDGGLIPTLNDVGDVSYSHLEQQFTPSLNDVLIYRDDGNGLYKWAPVELNIEELSYFAKSGSTICIDNGRYTGIQFHNVYNSAQDNQAAPRVGLIGGRMSLSMGDLSLELEGNEGYLYVGDRLVIRGRMAVSI